MKASTVLLADIALHRHHGWDALAGQFRPEPGQRAIVLGVYVGAIAGALAGGQHNEAGTSGELSQPIG